MLNNQEQQQSAVDSVDDLLESLGAPLPVVSTPTPTKKAAPPLPAKNKSGDDLLDEADRLLDLLGEAAPGVRPAATVAPTPALDDDLVSLLTSLDTTAAAATVTSNAIAASKWDKPMKPSEARLNKTPPQGQYGTLPVPPPATSNDSGATTTKPKEASSHYGTLPPTSQRVKAAPDSPAAHIPAQLRIDTFV